MRTKILTIFFVTIFLVIFFIFYKGLQNPNIYQPKIGLEKNIPIFNAGLLNNDNQINSKEIFDDNNFYLLNIWASWCVPCRDEHEFLLSLSKQKNVKIIGLNYKDKKKNAKTFLKELSNPYEIVFLDQDGTLAIEWGAYGVPESFLILNNKVIKKIIGPITKATIKEIKELIQ
tara:strand:- start:999 stop:1517 length:519 start_codon:yes stop_codon:yes gene_type:complete